ncbi:MAG TPA: serine/threonine-protein kinase [Gemmatimonadales bacterium]|nr:serine/threonine-protein kinase [Gemmatimonadales bacterium]
MPDTAPKQVGKYLITDLLGQGAMGVVYRALDPLLNRYVAVKVMSHGIATDQELRDRFLREARAAGSLQHPNIITIYDFGETDGSLYIAMEYVEGSDLSEIMARRDPLPLTGKIDIVVDALHALDYAHSRGVVHRDVKPANIRVSTDGRAKLMDFGIARLEKSDLTKSGMMMGTPSYMAPEQITGGAITPATDVFAIGAVLYEFLSNRPTFEGDTMHAVLYKVVSEQPPPLREVASTLPVSLQPIVDKALHKEAKRRYPTAGAMAKDLEAVRAALSGGATVRVAARSTPLRTTVRAEALRGLKRRRYLRWVGLGAGVAAIGVAAFLIFGGRVRRPSAGPAATGAAAPKPAVTAPAPGQVPAVRESAQAALPGADSTVAAAATTPAPAGRQQPPAQPAEPGKPHLGGARTALSNLRHPGGAPAQPGGAVSPSQPAGQAAAGQAAAPPQAAPAQPTPVTPSAQAPSPAPAGATSVPAPAPAPIEPQAAAQPEAPPDPRPQIEDLVAAYAHAIESMSVADMRRVYPGMRAEQRDNWSMLFSHARGPVKAELTLADLSVTGASATVRVTGHLEYDVGAGMQKPLVDFRAVAAQEGGVWRFRAIP